MLESNPIIDISSVKLIYVCPDLNKKVVGSITSEKRLVKNQNQFQISYDTFYDDNENEQRDDSLMVSKCECGSWHIIQLSPEGTFVDVD